MISAALVLGAMGTVRRIGFGTAEGRDTARILELDGGKLVLATKDKTWRGREAVFSALALPWRRLLQMIRWQRDGRR
jgi:hypothetical protein